MSRMSELDYDRQIVDTVRDIVAGSPEQLVEERIARLADEMVDISMLALDPEQRPLVEREWRGISQILLRAQLMLSTFKGEDVEAIRRLIVALDYVKQPPLRVVQNNG